ncbi:MAG: MarR family winged helix-turn-helix transcriptional regulator [Candidatus Omnitrophota bacterium]
MGPVPDKEVKINQFANESPCICFNLRKAARAITQIYDHMFRGIGLTASQISILTSLRMIGSMSVSQLSQAMATDRTTITRNLKPLERDGLIKIKVGDDKRSRLILLTDKGNDLCDQSFNIFREFQQKVSQKLGKERMELMCKELNEAVATIQEI